MINILFGFNRSSRSAIVRLINVCFCKSVSYKVRFSKSILITLEHKEFSEHSVFFIFLSQNCFRSLEALLAYFVGKTEPKILCLVYEKTFVTVWLELWYSELSENIFSEFAAGRCHHRVS